MSSTSTGEQPAPSRTDDLVNGANGDFRAGRASTTKATCSKSLAPAKKQAAGNPVATLFHGIAPAGAR
ncbi:hypothetical protein [Streptomyces sp. NPDC059894]|uniref:hypothetical protein n=1 Tax=unclassified Streptomyces TaxID=2593676 RepID=UPI003650727D